MNIDYYVHLHAINYSKYGYGRNENDETSKSPESDLNYYIAKHDEIINKYKKSKEPLENKKIQTFYQKVFFDKLSDSKEDEIYKKLRDSYQKATNTVLQEKFKEKAGTIDDNFLLSVRTKDIEEQSKAYKEALKNTCAREVSNIDKNQYNYYKTYKKRVDDLRKIINKALKKENLEFKNLLEAELKQQGIADDILDLQKQLNEFLQKLGGQGSQALKKNMHISNDTKVIIKGKEVESFNYINSIINAIGKFPYWGSQANQAGIAGEIAASLYQYLISTGVQDVSAELVKEFNDKNSTLFKGASYTVIGNVTNNNLTPLNLVTKGEKSSIKIKETKINKTVSKTDVEISTDEGKPIRMSVKNYASIKGSLTIVNGTPLSKILHMIDTTSSFEGHYANLITESIGRNENNIISEYSNKIKEIVMQQSLIKAFEGYDEKNKPTIFVVFGSKENKVKVYNMKTLIGNFFNGKGSYYVESKHAIKANNLSNISNLTIPQGENGDKMTNMAKTLFNAHKLHVAINLGL